MAILPTQLARVSNLLRTSTAASQIARTQRRLLETQNQLSTGRRLNSASDDPGDAAVAQQLQKTLEQRQAFLTNLNRAKDHLGASTRRWATCRTCSSAPRRSPAPTSAPTSPPTSAPAPRRS